MLPSSPWLPLGPVGVQLPLQLGVESSWGQHQSGRETPCNSFTCELSGSPGLTAISPLALPFSFLKCIGIWPELRLCAEPFTAVYSSLSSAKSQSPKVSQLCLQMTAQVPKLGFLATWNYSTGLFCLEFTAEPGGWTWTEDRGRS